MTSVEFSNLIQHERQTLKNYALTLTRNIEDANDLVQETMLKAFSYRNKFAVGTNLKGWLYIIMKNSFINNYRKLSRRKIVIDTSDNGFLLDNASEVAYNAGERAFLKSDIDQAIRELPDDLRITFSMNMEGYKYHEIAEELDIPIGTVKTRIFVAKRKLRNRLHTHGKNYGLKEG
ncbi:MAG: RNA polymerase sigma factor [Flavobacteriales bacterium]|nr:RNA polymerase sigma factor [Flavobacteriales bacterium]